MKILFPVLATMLQMMFFYGCQKHEINNPFDSECPKELWTPSSLTAGQQENEIVLTWKQSNQHISGFKIERKVGSVGWSPAGTVAKGTTSWNDNDLKAGQLHEYRLCAYAGKNQSNTLMAQVTPVLASTVTTLAVTVTSCNTATSGGTVTSDGGASVTARGVCWNKTGNPTVADNKTTNGSGTGNFTSNLTGLTEKTTYYAKAYATNSKATSYGSQESFTTMACKTVPTVVTSAITKITQISAQGGGNVTADGGSPVTARGICWSTTKNPTTDNSKTTNGSGLGSYTSIITGLTANTTYYVRAYATNSIGTGYGTEADFNSVNPASTIFSFIGSATSWSTDIDFTYISTSGSISTYRINSRNLTEDEQFKIRTNHLWDVNYGYNNITITGESSNFYSIGSDGNIGVYSERTYELNLTVNWINNAIALNMNNLTPSVSTAAVTSISTTYAISGGNIANQGTSPVTTRGVCWSTGKEPTINNSKTSNGSGVGSFTGSISGLTSNTAYFVRAYAANNSGTSYGSQITFTTMPGVTTISLTDIRLGSCTTGGTVASGGGVYISQRGICWGTTSNPTISNNTLPGGYGSGSFCNTITGLSCGGTSYPYYIRAYATNISGTSYGQQVTFTPNACLTILASLKVSSVSVSPKTLSVGNNIGIQATLSAVTINTTRVGFYLSGDNKFDPCNDTFLKEASVNFSSGSAAISFFYTIPIGLSGTYYIFCVADNTWNLASNGARGDDVLSDYFTVK